MFYSEPPCTGRRTQLDGAADLGVLLGTLRVFRSETKIRREALNVISAEEGDLPHAAPMLGRGSFNVRRPLKCTITSDRWWEGEREPKRARERKYK